jgi:virginiamycin B lyase
LGESPRRVPSLTIPVPPGTASRHPISSLPVLTGRWFTNAGNNSIGRITTAGVVTNYPGAGIAYPAGIAVGPDGALWFSNYGNNSIGKITTAGTVTNYTGAGIANPWDMTVGPDGALWFANYGNNSIGRITIDGAL